MEERFKRTESGVLQYIIIAKVHHALSWESIATSLNRRYRGPAWLTGLFNGFDAGLVEEIFQLHAEARTTIFEGCVGRDWVKLSSTTVPTGKIRREAPTQKRISPFTPAATILAENQWEN